MMKAIYFKDVRPGDVVCGEERWPFEVGTVQADWETGNELILLRSTMNILLRGRPNRVLGLLHRPWPEGKTEADMQWTVIVCSQKVEHTRKMEQLNRDFTLLGEAIVQLREAIEVYELGKPLAEDK